MADDKDYDRMLKKFIKANEDLNKVVKKSAVDSIQAKAAMEGLFQEQLVHDAKEKEKKYKEDTENLTKKIMEERKLSKEASEIIVAGILEGEEKNAQKREKREQSFVGRITNSLIEDKDKGKTDEERIESARQQKGFFKSLKDMFSKKDKDASGGIFGFMKKIFSKIKGVFKFIVGKFLLIGALVVGLISSMNMDQLKEVWGKLKEAFKAIWEFLEPIITTIWEWISDTAIPAIVDSLMNSFKSIGELFKNLKERFSGFTEMSWVERMWAIFGAFKDIGSFLGDMIGNFAVTVEKMFGGDGTWITGIWESIKGFFNSIGEFLTNLFTNPVETIDGMIMGTFAWMKDIGKWIYDTLITPFVDWFKTLLDFSSIGKTLESLINIVYIIPNTIKKFLLDPAVKWVGDMFGFDTSAFTDFNIGQLAMQGIDRIINWFEEKFDFKMPKFSMPEFNLVQGFKDMLRPLLEKASVFVPNDLLEWVRAKPKKKTPVIPSDTRSEKDKKKDFGRWSATEEGKAYMMSFKDDGPDGKGKTGIIGSNKRQHRAYAAFMAEQSKPKESRIQKSINKRLMHKKLAEQHRAGKSGELAQIQADEGFREGVYEDTVGIKTIGYGFNLERQGSQEALDAAGIKKSLADLKGGKANLTEEEASRLMQGEMGHFKGVAERYVGTATWKKLSPNRQGILTNMAYNMGEGGLGQFSNLKAAIQKGDWKEAQVQMASSKWAGQVKGRADRLVARMGADDKSNALNSVQQANLVAKETKGTSPGSITVTKGGDTTIHKEETTMLAGTAVDLNHPQSTRQTTTTT